jgi:hypothetical protein
MNLVKGDGDNLEGKVFIYSKSPFSNSCIGVSFAPTIEGAITIYAAACELSEDKRKSELEKRTEEMAKAEQNSSSKCIEEELAKQGHMLIGPFKFYSSIFDFNAAMEAEHYKFECDIIDVEEALPCAGAALQLMFGIGKDYLALYIKQQVQKRIDELKKKMSGQSETGESRDARQKNYTQLPKEEAKKRFIDLASGINYALEIRGNDGGSKLSDAANSFHAFFENTALENFAGRYYLELLKNKDNNELAGCYFQMIAELIEDSPKSYRNAARLRDKIKEKTSNSSS